MRYYFGYRDVICITSYIVENVFGHTHTHIHAHIRTSSLLYMCNAYSFLLLLLLVVLRCFFHCARFVSYMGMRRCDDDGWKNGNGSVHVHGQLAEKHTHTHRPCFGDRILQRRTIIKVILSSSNTPCLYSDVGSLATSDTHSSWLKRPIRTISSRTC